MRHDKCIFDCFIIYSTYLLKLQVNKADLYEFFSSDIVFVDEN